MSDSKKLVRVRTMIGLFCVSAATTTTILIAIAPLAIV
jgi:hypothetical protein